MENDKMDTPRESPRETKSPEEERGWMPGSEAVASPYPADGRRAAPGREVAGPRGWALGHDWAALVGEAMHSPSGLCVGDSTQLQRALPSPWGSRRDSEGAGARGRAGTTRAGEMIDETDQAECEVVRPRGGGRGNK